MTVYVVDASVAIKWLIYENLSDEAVAFARLPNYLIAPCLIMTEIANALVRKTIRGDLSTERALNEYSKLPLFFDELIAVEDTMVNAIENACRFRHPIYDLIYLEVARQRGVQLLTADQRLASKLTGTEPARHVTLLSDWRPT